MSLDIKHRPEAGRFVLEDPGGECYIAYRQQGGTVDFYYTYVPPALRGKGLGEALVRVGRDYALKKGLEIQASCSFVGHTLARMGD